MSQPAPVLLTMASYHGTLAAVRCLGRRGVPVTVADSSVLSKASWSRYAARRVRCPRPEDPGRFMPWLLEFGRKNPGHVLYPTSDDVAWLVALHEQELRPYFRLWQPKVTVIYGLLNKKRLMETCAEVGLDAPASWFPRDAAELERLAPDLPYPILLKPQTQILYWPHAKGLVAESREMLPQMVERFRREAGYAAPLLEFDPGVTEPMLQTYFKSAVDSIYSLSGFLDESGELWVMRSSRKVLQRPRQLGVGLAFEEAAVIPEVAEKVRALCKTLGYFGVFEAEFIVDEGKHLLIDFNPRFYGQMQFDISRGLPLPMMVYAAATGQRDLLAREVEQARAAPELQGRVFSNRMELRALLIQQRLGGHLSKADTEHWEKWLSDHDGQITDAIVDPDDQKPAAAHTAQEIYGYVRHPRSFVRQVRSNARQ